MWGSIIGVHINIILVTLKKRRSNINSQLNHTETRPKYRNLKNLAQNQNDITKNYTISYHHQKHVKKPNCEEITESETRYEHKSKFIFTPVFGILIAWGSLRSSGLRTWGRWSVCMVYPVRRPHYFPEKTIVWISFLRKIYPKVYKNY